ncbi:hypothetical protein BGZ67_001161 [Mortierella alpina]|nr:hypothetical protein BGZ67_001161 [Mortierella alpina]
MPYSPSPERHHDRRGPPKDWDAPEAEEGEISHYSGRRGVGGHRDDMDVEEGEYRKRKGDSDSEDDKDGKKDRRRTSKKDAVDAEKPLEELSPEDEEARMMALMGFGGFDSTKGKKVAGADVSGADIKKQRQYRQYMNRRGGFNRPLDAK